MLRSEEGPHPSAPVLNTESRSDQPVPDLPSGQAPPGYQIYEARSHLDNWVKYVTIISYILLIIGGIKTILSLVELLTVGAVGFLEIEGPDGT